MHGAQRSGKPKKPGNVMGYFLQKKILDIFHYILLRQRFLYSKKILLCNDIFLSHYVGIH